MACSIAQQEEHDRLLEEGLRDSNPSNIKYMHNTEKGKLTPSNKTHPASY